MNAIRYILTSACDIGLIMAVHDTVLYFLAPPVCFTLWHVTPRWLPTRGRVGYQTPTWTDRRLYPTYGWTSRLVAYVWRSVYLSSVQLVTRNSPWCTPYSTRLMYRSYVTKLRYSQLLMVQQQHGVGLYRMHVTYYGWSNVCTNRHGHTTHPVTRLLGVQVGPDHV